MALPWSPDSALVGWRGKRQSPPSLGVEGGSWVSLPEIECYLFSHPIGSWGGREPPISAPGRPPVCRFVLRDSAEGPHHLQGLCAQGGVGLCQAELFPEVGVGGTQSCLKGLQTSLRPASPWDPRDQIGGIFFRGTQKCLSKLPPLQGLHRGLGKWGWSRGRGRVWP